MSLPWDGGPAGGVVGQPLFCFRLFSEYWRLLMKMRNAVFVVAVGAVALSGVTTGPALAGPMDQRATPVVVVTGLNNPRQLALAPDGSLYIAEAGRGALDPTNAPCGELRRGQGCTGMTGSVSRVVHPWSTHDAQPERVVTGLLSAAPVDGTSADGPSGVSIDMWSRVHVAMTYVPDSRLLPTARAAEQNGHALEVGPHSVVWPTADIAGAELSQDLPAGPPNPYSVLALPDRQIVADSGTNSVLQVTGKTVSVLTPLPNHDGGESVPTSVTLGPDGDYYVTEFGGWRATPNTARVYRIARDGHIVSWQSGFSRAMSVAFGADGAMYVSELYADRVVKVAPDGTRTSVHVPTPSGLAVDGAGTVYVSAYTTSTAADPRSAGQVWRLRF
jgi:hypothetical protein